jgi:hypothetical protein
MEINRSNYEIWLIDWLDGNLNDLQVAKVQLFLNHNPDLKNDFEDISTFRLNPSEIEFKGKTPLKKSTADLTDKQFEYLCVASLERDISVSQKAELNEIIKQDQVKRRSFETIQKLRLSPLDISYPYKKHLIKRAVSQKIIRWSIVGLSAAATIALLVTTSQLIPRALLINSKDGMLSVSVTGNNSRAGMLSVSNNKPVKPIRSLKPEVTSKESEIISEKDPGLSLTADTIIRVPAIEGIQISNIPFPDNVDKNTRISKTTLVVSNHTNASSSFDEERSNVGRFIAKNFREIFLKEKTPKDSPLKGYEIAEVGVTGLNKLLGWEMALDKNNDENGELKSVYFSSKILKFNTPVKKTEPQP